MIINPSAQPTVPRAYSFERHSMRRRRQFFGVPGGKRFYIGVAKVLCGAGLFLFLSSLWLGSSIDQVTADISRTENQHEQLVNANILLRAQKAQLFSPETIGALAGDKFAIHLPESGQYKKF